MITSKYKLSFTLGWSRKAFRHHAVMFLFIFIFSTPLLNIATKSVLMTAVFAMVLIIKPSLSRREAKWIFIALFAFTPSIIIDFYWLTQYSSVSVAGFFIIFAVLFSVVVASRFDAASTQEAYANVVTALALISCIIFSVSLVMPEILSFAFQYSFYEFPGLSFGLQNFVIADGILVYRNAGFASEPGTFQVFVNIAAAILFQLKKMTILRFLILGTAIITANSTTGLLTFVAIALFASDNRYRVLAIFTLLIGFKPFLSLALVHYEAKFLTETAFLGRFEPIMNALNVIQQHPFGFGTVRYDHYLQTLQIGSHDGYTQTLVRFGLFGFLFFIGSLARLAKRQLGIMLAIALGSVSNNLLPIPPLVFFLFIDWDSLRKTRLARQPKTPI